MKYDCPNPPINICTFSYGLSYSFLFPRQRQHFPSILSTGFICIEVRSICITKMMPSSLNIGEIYQKATVLVGWPLFDPLPLLVIINPLTSHGSKSIASFGELLRAWKKVTKVDLKVEGQRAQVYWEGLLNPSLEDAGHRWCLETREDGYFISFLITTYPNFSLGVYFAWRQYYCKLFPM